METLEEIVCPPQEESCDTGNNPVPESETLTVPISDPIAPAEEEQAAAPKKKSGKLRAIIIISASILVLLAIFLVILFTVILPNNYYDQAVAAFENNQFSECQMLLDKIPTHEGTQQLQTKLTFALAEKALADKDYAECQRLLEKIPDYEKSAQLRQALTLAQAELYIETGNLDQADALLLPILTNPEAKALADEIIYLRAKDALDRKNWTSAKAYMAKIPNHEDPEQINNELKYQDVFTYLEAGNYESAYLSLCNLGNYKDAFSLKDTVYYEALALRSLLQIRTLYKSPASVQITQACFYKDSTEEGELDFYAKITATNGFGGSAISYAVDLSVYAGEPDGYAISSSDYVDRDDFDSWLIATLVDSVKKQEQLSVSLDIARINRLLKNCGNFKVGLDFSKGNSVVV